MLLEYTLPPFLPPSLHPSSFLLLGKAVDEHLELLAIDGLGGGGGGCVAVVGVGIAIMQGWVCDEKEWWNIGASHFLIIAHTPFYSSLT